MENVVKINKKTIMISIIVFILSAVSFFYTNIEIAKFSQNQMVEIKQSINKTMSENEKKVFMATKQAEWEKFKSIYGTLSVISGLLAFCSLMAISLEGVVKTYKKNGGIGFLMAYFTICLLFMVSIGIFIDNLKYIGLEFITMSHLNPSIFLFLNIMLVPYAYYYYLEFKRNKQKELKIQ